MTLFGCWLVQLIIGAQLAMGNTSVYFISYYRNTLGFDVDSNTFYPMQPLIVLFASLFFPLGNILMDKCGNQSKPVILVGGLTAIFCVSMCAYI